MRLIGMAERGLDLMVLRATDPAKIAFGTTLATRETVVQAIAESRIDIDTARLLVLTAALQVSTPPADSNKPSHCATCI